MNITTKIARINRIKAAWILLLEMLHVYFEDISYFKSLKVLKKLINNSDTITATTSNLRYFPY